MTRKVCINVLAEERWRSCYALAKKTASLFSAHLTILCHSQLLHG
uniref:Uncharacterized protein n=1 Tax=Arundo donax TaxID=35708 RepID=A0A0A8Y5L6_ARUDO